MDKDVERIVQRFRMQPHPEGGYFIEVYRSDIELAHPKLAGETRRAASTLIYYLLEGAQYSSFHRVRCSDEVWHLYAGGPLEVHVIDSGYTRHVLTTPEGQGEPAAVVPAGAWQAARLAPGAAWAFIGCTVAPGFDFADFEMPTAEALIAMHPDHSAIIGELTRS